MKNTLFSVLFFPILFKNSVETFSVGFFNLLTETALTCLDCFNANVFPKGLYPEHIIGESNSAVEKFQWRYL